MDPDNLIDETISKKNIEKRNYLITIEPIYFIIYFCYSLTDAACLNLILSRTCTVVFNYSEKNCTDNIEEKLPYVNHAVHTYAAKIVMWQQLVSAIFPAIICLFIGSWMDTCKRRKPFLIVPVIGTGINYAVWIIFVCFSSLPPSFVIIAILPYSLSGGFIILYTCGYCYISDITNEDNRAFRMSVASLSIAVGTVFGYLLANVLFQRVENNIYLILFVTSFCCLVLTLLYTVYVLPEPLVNVKENKIEDRKTNSKSFLMLSHITESFSVVSKKRESNGRAILYLLIVITVMQVLVSYGEHCVKYLSLRAAFSWNEQHYNTYAAILDGVAATMGSLGVWLLSKKLKFSETFIILLVSSSTLCSSVLLSISRTPTDFYSAELLGSLSMVIDPIIKSEITQIIPDCEIGKVLAISSVLEEVAPIIGAPMYVQIYNTVFSYEPFYVYFLSSSFRVLALLCSAIILIIQCLSPKQRYEPLLMLSSEEDELVIE